MELRKSISSPLVGHIGPILLIAAIVSLVYAPVTHIPYAPAGDDQKLLWPESSHTCCRGAFDSPTWLYLGRGLGALLANVVHNSLFEIEDLALARKISLLAMIGVSIIGYFIFRRAGAPSSFAFIAALGAALLPGVTQGVVHAHAGIFLIFPSLFALPAGQLAVEAARKSMGFQQNFNLSFVVLATISFFLLLSGLWIYPAVATIFLAPVVYAVLFDVRNGVPLIRMVVITLSIFLGASITYFIVHQFIFLPLWLPDNPRFANLTTGARFELAFLLNGEILQGKVTTLLNDFARATVLWFPTSSVRISQGFSIAIVFMGVVSAMWNMRMRAPGGLLLKIFVVLALLILSDIANLAAASGTSGFRLVIAMQLILLGMLLWSLHHIAVAILPSQAATVAGALGLICVAAGALAAQEQAVRGAANATMMWSFIKSRVAEAAGQRIDAIHVIRPIRSPAGFAAFIGGNATEMVNTELTPFIVATALAELGYQHPLRFSYREYESGMTIVVGPNDVLIDMNLISPRPTPRYRDIKFHSKRVLRRDFGNVSPEVVSAPFEDSDLPTPSIFAVYGPIGPDYRVVNRGVPDPFGDPTATQLSISRCGAGAPRMYAPTVVRRMDAGDEIEISAWANFRAIPGPIVLGVVLEPGARTVEASVDPAGTNWMVVAARLPILAAVQTYRPYIRFGASAPPEACPGLVDIWGFRAIGRGGYLETDRFGRPTPKIINLLQPLDTKGATHQYPLSNLFDDSPSMTELRINLPFDLVFRRDAAAALRGAFWGYSFLADADKGAIDRLPAHWCIRGSNDGSQWRDIECRMVTDWQVNERRSFTFDEPVSDRFLKISILQVGSSDLLRLSGLGLDFR